MVEYHNNDLTFLQGKVEKRGWIAVLIHDNLKRPVFFCSSAKTLCFKTQESVGYGLFIPIGTVLLQERCLLSLLIVRSDVNVFYS